MKNRDGRGFFRPIIVVAKKVVASNVVDRVVGVSTVAARVVLASVVVDRVVVVLLVS